MPVDVAYKVDWKDPDSGWRFRLEVRPPYSNELSLIVPPAWGVSSEDDGGGYVDIPPEAVSTPVISESSFDALPIGMPTTPIATIEWDLTYLTGSTDLDDLRGYILDGKYDDGISYAVTGDYTITKDAPTVYRILSDRGTPSTPIAGFNCEFIGVQQVMPVNKARLGHTPPTKKIEISAVHVGRAVLEMISIEALAAWILDHDLTDTTIVAGDWERCYDAVYVAAGATHALGSVTRGDDEERFMCRFFTEHSVGEAVQTIASELMELVLRDNLGQLVLSDYSALEGAWQFKHQKYDGTTGAGSVISDPGDNLVYIGAYWQDTTRTFEDAYADGELIGGAWIAQDPESFHAMENAYALMQDYVRGCLRKATWDLGVENFMLVRLDFHAPLDGPANSGGARTIQRSGIRVASTEEVEVEFGAGVFHQHLVAVQGAEGDDLATVGVPATQSILNDQDYGVSAWWRTSPTVGNDDDWRFERTGAPEITGVPAFAGYRRFFCRKLYVLSDADGALTDPYPILPSGIIACDFRGNGVYVNVYGSLPAWAAVQSTAGFGGGGSSQTYTMTMEAWKIAQLARFLDAQSRACMEYGISKAIGLAFNNPRQWRLSVPVDLARGTPNFLGAALLLRNDADTDYAALDLFTQNDPDFGTSRFPPAAIVMSLAMNPSFADITLLGVS
jgi:hypothetical protein